LNNSLDLGVFRGVAFSSIVGVFMATSTGLGAPSATIIPGESQALINWTPPGQSINGIEIEESVDSGTTWSLVTKLPPTSTHIRVQNLLDGKNYWFRVRWIWPDNSLGIPSPTLVAVPINIPSAPTGLVATASETEVALSWDQTSSPTVIGYDIEQSTDGGNTWQVIKANTGSNSSGYLVDGLTPGTTYTYRIKALAFGGGESEYSDSTEAKIATSTLGGFGLHFAIENSKVILIWDTPSDLPDVVSYDINASSDGGNVWAKVATVPGGTNTTAVPYVIGGATYQVIATSTAGQTSASAIELVQTNAISAPTTSSQGNVATIGDAFANGYTSTATNTSSQSNSKTSNTVAVTKKGTSPLLFIIAGLLIIGGVAWAASSQRNRKAYGKRGKSRKRPTAKRKPTRKPVKRP